MGIIISFLAGFLARDYLGLMRANNDEYNRENQVANLAPEILENAPEGQIQENLNNENQALLAIEANNNEEAPQENNPENNDLYERSREQWWQRFGQPVYASTRSRYRNNARNVSEERLYQLM